MEYVRTMTLEAPYEEAVRRVKEAFKAQGFGTLTEIDVRATLREKLGVDVEPYVILGTCNPNLAHRALEAEPALGALLPCNVVVRREAGRTMVHALDPLAMAEVTGNPALGPIAEEAGRLVQAALDSLTGVLGP